MPTFLLYSDKQSKILTYDAWREKSAGKAYKNVPLTLLFSEWKVKIKFGYIEMKYKQMCTKL